MNKLEIRQELEKLAKKLVATDMGSPVGEGAQLQALWILHQLCDEPAKNADGGIFSETFEALREAHREEIALIQEMRQQILDKDGLIFSLTARLTDSIRENLSIQSMVDVLANAQTMRRGGDSPGLWAIDSIQWNKVHACTFRAPEFIYIENDRLSAIDVNATSREWVRIDLDGKISLSPASVVTGLEFIDEKTAAVYRFDDPSGLHAEIPAQGAKLVWERRFMYMAQMTQEQLRAIKEGEKKNG